MHPAPFFTGIAGIATVTALLTIGAAHIEHSSADTVLTAATEDATGTVDTANALPGDGSPAAAGNGIAVPDDPVAPVTRQPAAAGQTAQSMAPDNPPATSESSGPQTQDNAAPESRTMIELIRPVVEQAGVLSFGERRLQLKDIVPTPPDRICTGQDGKGWPCGMMAKTALRLFLRKRTVACNLPAAEWQGTASAECSIGAQSIAGWLVENGWVEAVAGSPLAGAGEEAQREKRGIYGNDPRRAGAGGSAGETGD